MMTIRMNWVIAIIVKLSLYCFWDVVVAFPVTPPLALVVPLRSAHPKIRSPTTSTTLYGLLGRFRNKRTVEQGKMIQPGSELPKVDVEQLVFSPDGGPATSEAVAILDVVGTTTKALLIGMHEKISHSWL